MAGSPPFLTRRLDFPLPCTEPHLGIPLSTTTLGVLLWGEGRTLRVTLNRADFLSSQGRGEAPGPSHPRPPAPDPLPMGRVDLLLPADWMVAGGGLFLAGSEAEVELDGGRAAGKARGTVLHELPVFCLRLTGMEGGRVAVISRPPDSAEMRARFEALGMPKPSTFDLDEFGGWVQELPDGRVLCVGWLRHVSAGGLLLYATAAYGDTPAGARKEALGVLESASAEGYTPVTVRSLAWRRRWWSLAGPIDSAQELLECLARYRDSAPGPETRAEAPSPAPPDLLLEIGAGGAVVVRQGSRTLQAPSLRPSWLDGDSVLGHEKTLRNGKWGYW